MSLEVRLALDRVLSLDTWVTSDHHWSHTNIRKYQGRPDDHFDLMRERWFECVALDDVVLHLGDLVCYGNQADHPTFVSGLPGHKFLLRGNHDDHDSQWYSEAGFAVVGKKPIWWAAPDARVVCFTHRPINDPEKSGFDVNVHGHIHLNTHHGALPQVEYRNVCVEVTGYGPVRLRDVLRDEYRTDRVLSPA